MTRAWLGWAFVLHGLGHAGAGMWADGPTWIVTASWWLASVGFMAAGSGLLGVPPFVQRVPAIAFAGAVASLTLLAFFRHPLAAVGALIGLTLLGFTMLPGASSDRAVVIMSRRRPVALLATLGVLLHVSVAILARPWEMRMGTTAADRTTALFGDSLYPDARYLVDNAITIHAPVDSVWPWLAQMGQDRGGFYSYEWLEDLFGARITNAERVIPAWTTRQAGDFVRAVPADWLGGVFGDSIGWRIVAMDSGRALVLENWGAFTLRPIDSSTTRFQIRQRNPGQPSLGATVLAPIGLLVLEPAHFIMQRGMLRGVRTRAERG